MPKLDHDRIHLTSAGDGPSGGRTALPVSVADLEQAGAAPSPALETLRRAGFGGGLGEALALAAVAGEAGTQIAFGVGPRMTVDGLRAGAMALGRRLDGADAIAVDLAAHPAADQPSHAAAIAEGTILGSYRWTPPTAAEPPGPELLLHVSDEAREETAAACRRAAVRARAANWARRLTDTPPSELIPEQLAALAAEVAEAHGWQVASLAGDALLDAGLTAIHAVGRGSRRPPQLIDLTYAGRGGGAADVVLIGKGITMDCGGLNLKTERPIAAVMKSDMAGAAAALATLAAAAALELPVNVRVLIPAAENMPGPDAVLPGDVIEHFGGRRTEVVLTDAEGRLVLADCLAYARHGAGDAALIDVGTLSEAPFAPAGWTVACDDPALAAALARAAAATGELAVPFPRVAGYEGWIASAVADSTNFSYAHGSQDLMVVPAFLAPFAGEGRWAHIDVCAVAYLYDAWSTWPQGATGSPTRPLVELLAAWDGIAAGTSR
jgi:leucyl aminopeptidase